MKYKIFVLLLSVLICFTSIVCSAQELSAKAPDIDEEWHVFLKAQITDDELAILNDASLYDASMKNVSIGDEPILKVYTNVYWHLAHLSVNEIIPEASKDNFTDYVILGEENTRLCIWNNNGKTSVGLSNPSAFPSFVNDIRKMTVNMSILGNDCTVTGIHCFNGFSSYSGSLVYLVTSKGVFVKYYEYENSEGSVWYTEDQFKKYASAYYGYISSYEHNYTADGQGLCNSTSFKTYVSEIYGTENEKHPPLINTNTQKTDKLIQPLPIPQKNSQIIATVAIVTVSVIIVASGIITAVIIILTKRRKRS